MTRTMTGKQFESEVLEHLPSMMTVAARLMRHAPEAEDLVKDSIVKAIRARDQYEAGTNLRAWLLKILTNTFINRYRRGGIERDLFEGPDAEPLSDAWMSSSSMNSIRDPETQALRPIIEAELARALDELPPEFRLAVILSDVEELSYKEIAEVMGCPIGTVMSRLHRGRKILQGRLRDHATALGIVSAEPTPVRAPTDITEYRKRRAAV